MSVVDFYGNVPNHKGNIRRSQEKTVDKNKSHPHRFYADGYIYKV